MTFRWRSHACDTTRDSTTEDTEDRRGEEREVEGFGKRKHFFVGLFLISLRPSVSSAVKHLLLVQGSNIGKWLAPRRCLNRVS